MAGAVVDGWQLGPLLLLHHPEKWYVRKMELKE
jgi:hypothetical protein